MDSEVKLELEEISYSRKMSSRLIQESQLSQTVQLMADSWLPSQAYISCSHRKFMRDFLLMNGMKESDEILIWLASDGYINSSKRDTIRMFFLESISLLTNKENIEEWLKERKRVMREEEAKEQAEWEAWYLPLSSFLNVYSSPRPRLMEELTKILHPAKIPMIEHDYARGKFVVHYNGVKEDMFAKCKGTSIEIMLPMLEFQHGTMSITFLDK